MIRKTWGRINLMEEVADGEVHHFPATFDHLL